MEKEFVSYKQSLALKELGFNEPCLDYFANSNPQNSWTISYNSDDLHRPFESVARPTFSQAFSWFRDNYGLYASIVPKKSYPDGYVSGIEWVVNICGGNGEEIGPDDIFTYKEAEIAGLTKLIEIIKG